MAWSVYLYGSPPAFLSIVDGIDESTLTMDPTLDSEIGMYTINLIFTPDGQTANAITTNLIVHVYPAEEYTSINTTLQCQTNIWPIYWSSTNGDTYYLGSDIDSNA